ncbi:hypothetical protein [Haloechinothrix halophila]|uniref:hypothetical protein n=1 Tax=Haloechinothrix halophila TaxID=1069073 RepID=UPI0003F9F680|nr:hypothetical protein [Haloechinothrix halophila]
MAFEKNRVRAAVLALPLAVGLSLGAATAAQAATFEEDDRATIHTGNAKDCDDVGLDGSVIVQIDGEEDFGTELIEYERGELEEDQYLDILSIEDGVEVTGIVVKGGEDANIYVPGENGLEENPPWEDLRSPLNAGDKIPQISHWYICGSYTPPETTTTTTTSETTTTTSSETSTTPPETTSTTEETTTAETTTGATSTTEETTSVAETSTTEAPVVDNASDSDDLAVTGFGSSWLIWAGVLFVVAGVGTIAGLRVLRKQ